MKVLIISVAIAFFAMVSSVDAFAPAKKRNPLSVTTSKARRVPPAVPLTTGYSCDLRMAEGEDTPKGEKKTEGTFYDDEVRTSRTPYTYGL